MAAVRWIHPPSERYSFSLTRGAACSVCAFVVFLSLGPAGGAPQSDAVAHLGQPTTERSDAPISDRACVMKWRAAYAAHYELMERRRAEDLARETEGVERTADAKDPDDRRLIRLASSSTRGPRGPAVQIEEAVAFWSHVRAASERALENESAPGAVASTGETVALPAADPKTPPANPPAWSFFLAMGLSLPIGILAAASYRAGAPNRLTPQASDPVLRIRVPSMFFDSPLGAATPGAAMLRPVAAWTELFIAAAAVVMLTLGAKCLLVSGAWTEFLSNPLSGIAALWGG